MKTNSKVSKRIISLVLTVLLVLSMVPMSVFSAFAEEVSELSEGLAELSATIDTGAEVTLSDADCNGYYDISTADELYAFAALVNGGNTGLNAELTADIVVNEGTMSAETTGARVWTPIGNNSNKYTGIFDGNNKAVSGLYFNNNATNYVGLFGYVGTNGTVKNTGVINSYFNGNWDVGGVVGYNYNGTITNCYNTGAVSGEWYVGGVVGFNGYYGTITNCYNTGEVSGSGSYVGGVAGSNGNGTITNCYYLNTAYTGGIGIVMPLFSYAEDIEGSAEAKTAEAFASGEVAYLLGEAFGQNIDNEDYPVLGGDKVYQVENCIGESIYRNINENIDHNFENGFCTVCGDFEPATDVDNDGVYEIATQVSFIGLQIK